MTEGKNRFLCACIFLIFGCLSYKRSSWTKPNIPLASLPWHLSQTLWGEKHNNNKLIRVTTGKSFPHDSARGRRRSLVCPTLTVGVSGSGSLSGGQQPAGLRGVAPRRRPVRCPWLWGSRWRCSPVRTPALREAAMPE